MLTIGINLVVILVLLILSALMSGSEVAYFSLSKSEIEDFREKDKNVWDLLQKPRRLLATILITNNLVNVALIILSSFTLKAAADFFAWTQPGWPTFLLSFTEVVVITFLLLFFGEITPKIFATQQRIRLVKMLASPLKVLRLVFSPMSWVLINSTRFIDKRIPVNHESTSFEDIKHAIDLTSEEDSPDEEKEILKGIVDFANKPVRSIMRSRVDVSAIDIETPFAEVIEIINEYGYSRIPIYAETLDQVKGILYIKDLLPLLKETETNPEWQKLIRQAYFVPETKKIDDLLDEFKQKRLHIAIVVDEFGGTAGIVTLEDIIEEIFGEINDEFDLDELVYSRISENIFVFEGKTHLTDLVKITGLPDHVFEEARGENDSLAGLILEIHGRIPEKGETIEFEKYLFTIESVSKNRIKRVKFTILQEEEVSSANGIS
ncbi:MAG: gliding motility-associated protein GldE [Bacteroidia bacterium]|nr:gliding motility-associated protein GldE [Bacteroidia bacterium]